MVSTVAKKPNLSVEDLKRQKNIISKLNLSKLPFDISPDRMCALNLEMARHSSAVLKYQEDKSGIKWIFSSIKKYKVFLIIFESNELGEEIYKEKISSMLPEYSYKTVAQIVDEGMAKGFFINLKSSDKSKIYDKKIHNIRPSEELVADFINWNIDAICILKEFYNTKKKSS